MMLIKDLKTKDYIKLMSELDFNVSCSVCYHDRLYNSAVYI